MSSNSKLPKLEKSILRNLIIRHWTTKLVNFLQHKISDLLYSLKTKHRVQHAVYSFHKIKFISNIYMKILSGLRHLFTITVTSCVWVKTGHIWWLFSSTLLTCISHQALYVVVNLFNLGLKRVNANENVYLIPTKKLTSSFRENLKGRLFKQILV